MNIDLRGQSVYGDGSLTGQFISLGTYNTDTGLYALPNQGWVGYNDFLDSFRSSVATPQVWEAYRRQLAGFDAPTPVRGGGGVAFASSLTPPTLRPVAVGLGILAAALALGGLK